LGIHEIDHLWDDEDISLHEKGEHSKAESELYLSPRVLIHAVEGYLLGCVEYPDLTAEAALGRATSTYSLIDLLQAEEDLMIRTSGRRGWNTRSLLVRVVLMPFSPLRQRIFPNAELRLRAPQHRGVGRGSRQITSETVSEGVNELKPVEKETTVLSLPDPPGYSSFPIIGMEGALANADLAATSEVVALYQTRVAGCTCSLLSEGGTVAPCAREIG
jgi:hypothetical protein